METSVFVEGAERVLNNSELMSLIFGFLKTSTLAQANILEDYSKPPNLPKSWTGPFAQLALVNRAFCAASTDVLWENMSSVEPFFSVLLNSDPKEEDEALPGHSISYTQSGGPSSQEWSRFRSYASKTIRLVPTLSSSTRIDPTWGAYLAMSKDRPDPLFPRLKHLYLTKNDPLAMFVALSVTPVVRNVSVSPEFEICGENMAAFLTALSRNANNRLTLDLNCRLDTKLAIYLSKVSNLRSLAFTLSGPATSVDLGVLDNLCNLESLHIAQPMRLSPPPPAHIDPPDIAQPIARHSKLNSLRCMTIEGGSWLHWNIASKLSPRNLKVLTLKVIPTTHDLRMVLAPLAAAVHVQRNQSLVKLAICTYLPTRSAISSNWPNQLLDTRYSDIHPLLTGISGLKKLAHLTVSKVLFLQPDSQYLLLDVAMALPELWEFVLVTRNTGPWTQHPNTRISFQILSEVPKRLPCISTLVLPVDLAEEIPLAPEDYIPTHPLVSLGFDDLTPEMLAGYSETKKIALAEYLFRLFPQLNDLASNVLWESSPEIQNFCRSIEELIRFSRRSRELAVRDMERGLLAGSQSQVRP